MTGGAGRSAKALWAAPVLAGLLLTGCGSSSGMSAAAATALQADASAIDKAARAGDGAAVQAGVRRLRAHVATYRTSGDLSVERAARVVAAAAAVAVDVPAPVPTKPPPAPVVPKSDSDGKGDKDDKGDEGKKGKGKKD